MKKRKFFAVVAAIILITSSIITGSLCNASHADAFELRKNNPLEKMESVQGIAGFQKGLRAIYNEVRTSVVRIETEDTVQVNNPFMNDPFFRRFFQMPKGGTKQKKQGLGSGFIIDEAGYIVTNHHVVGKPDGSFVKKIKVQLLTGKTYTAEPVGSDVASDIALLKIDPGADKIKAAVIGDSDSIETGDLAIAIGNPFGLSSTFTLGFVSSKSQNIDTKDGMPRIQTDAAINPGNSGGPLLNSKGEVIGINQMIYSKGGGSIGIGFAIPINYGFSVLKKIKSGKPITHSYIGVAVISDIEPHQRKELGLGDSHGLLVGQVEIGSPAWKAGIRAYDFITKLDNKTLTKFRTLRSTIIRKGVGAKVKLEYLRNGKKSQTIIRIGERKKKKNS